VNFTVSCHSVNTEKTCFHNKQGCWKSFRGANINWVGNKTGNVRNVTPRPVRINIVGAGKQRLFHSIKFQENLSIGSRVVSRGWTDGQA
jgi:hypothetical protein